MKKILFCILIIFSFGNSYSQGYYKLLDKDTTTWQHFNCMIAVVHKNATNNFSGNDFPIVAIDSITINSKLYKKVYELNYYSINYTGKSLIGYMREDTISKKVYYRDNSTSVEYLLYDFSLNVNDSLFLTFPNSSDNGYYYADSIVIKNERCGPRKHFYIRKHANNSQPALQYIEYIESIGSTLHVLFPYATWAINSGCQFSWMNSSTCVHQWGVGLACKNNDTKKQYQSCTFTLAQMSSCLNPVDSCNYRNQCGGLQSSSLPAGITVFPNPANDYLSIKFEDSKSHCLTLEIIDLRGRSILSRKESGRLTDVTIDLNAVEKGLYLLKINIDNEVFSRPLSIER